MNLRKILTGIVLAGVLAALVLTVKHIRIQQGQSALLPATGAMGLKAKGAAVPKVTMVVYSDFQCPACQAAEVVMSELGKKYEKDLQIIFRHFPLQGHVWSPLAHQAAECANQMGKFWPYHDKLYHDRKGWSKPANPSDIFIGYAKDMGLNADDFAACLADGKMAELVNQDKKQGDMLQVNATPSFFINGERVVGPMDLKIKGEALIRKAVGLPALPPPPPAPKPVSPAVPAQQSVAVQNTSTGQAVPASAAGGSPS